MRSVYPVKHYKDEGFVEHKIELHDEYLEEHADFDFDEVEVVNNRPMNIWLYAKCRKYLDTDAPSDEQEDEASELGAEVTVTGKYDDNPTGR